MKLLLTGLVSVHWGRVENGNIGNYYIVEAAVRELHRVFPDAEILTTFQMSGEFAEKERVTVLPLELYYNWQSSDLSMAYQELAMASIYHSTGTLLSSTPYIDTVSKCDAVFDFSGEMWGDHAEPVGKDRFLVNLLKMRTSQLLNIPTVLLAGSQGPFSATHTALPFAKEVFKNYVFVANRESASKVLLQENGFDTSNVKSYTDPAFIFDPAPLDHIKNILTADNIKDPKKPTVGFFLCGFNMILGPYDKEDRSDNEYLPFVELVEFIVTELNARVYLMSHQNGFVRDELGEIHPMHGRDYPFAQRVHRLVLARQNVSARDVLLTKGPYSPKYTKAIISTFDMVVSGRIHAFVSAVSQCVPTVIINRGHGGVSHRNLGFARSAGMENYISNPGSFDDMRNKVSDCWANRMSIREELAKRMPVIQDTARQLFNDVAAKLKLCREATK
jgi:colanic acid/amylovoran biosynthesis protein